MKRRIRNRSMMVGGAVMVGAAVLSLPLVPSLWRYLRMKRM